MANNIRSTNLRFNLEKDLQRKAWEYLQAMDKQEFRSYSHVIALALVDYFDRYYRTQDDPYLETREREERFVAQIIEAVEKSLNQTLPLFLSGLTAGMAQREPQSRASLPSHEEPEPETDVDWEDVYKRQLCIHCNNLVINGRNIFLTFWKYLWFKRTLTILRYIYFEFTVFTTNSFRLCSITVIRLTGSFITIVSKMIIHFCFKHILKGSGKQIFKCLLNIIC